jgi:hypothetical protein
MAIWRSLLIAACLPLLSYAGPAHAAALPGDVKLTPDAAYVVLGLEPENSLIELDQVRRVDDQIRGFAFKAKTAAPVDGFVVIKVKPDEVYVVSAMSKTAFKSLFAVRYAACGEMATFKVGPGKVVYFTTLHYGGNGSESDGWNVTLTQGLNYVQNPQGARAFLKARYPNLADSLEQGSPAFETTTIRCP